MKTTGLAAPLLGMALIGALAAAPATAASFSGGAGSGYAMAEAESSLGGVAIGFSAASNQVFRREPDGVLPAAAFTITDGTPAPLIRAGTPLRLILPATARLAWNAAGPAPVFGGTAAGKVDSVLAYENGNKTAVVAVTQDFAAGDVLTIAGLSYADLLSVFLPARIELDATGDGRTDAFTGETVSVTQPCPGGPGVGYDMDAMLADASLVAAGTMILVY